MEKGYKILVVETKMDKVAGISVDTPEDLERVERIIDKMKGLSDGCK